MQYVCTAYHMYIFRKLQFFLGITPLFVKSSADVKTMNWVWFLPSAFTLILCIFTVRRSKPPTPPSRSSAEVGEKMPYLKRMKMLLLNKNYIAINISIGGAVGYFNCLATQLQQFMCSRGYSDEFSGNLQPKVASKICC